MGWLDNIKGFFSGGITREEVALGFMMAEHDSKRFRETIDKVFVKINKGGKKRKKKNV